jgi:hypothetical protein
LLDIDGYFRINPWQAITVGEGYPVDGSGALRWESCRLIRLWLERSSLVTSFVF